LLCSRSEMYTAVPFTHSPCIEPSALVAAMAPSSGSAAVPLPATVLTRHAGSGLAEGDGATEGETVPLADVVAVAVPLADADREPVAVALIVLVPVLVAVLDGVAVRLGDAVGSSDSQAASHRTPRTCTTMGRQGGGMGGGCHVACSCNSASARPTAVAPG
jgi:hypothetical protein